MVVRCPFNTARALKARQKGGITMARSNFKSVDEYIASQPEAILGVLERVRSAIRRALPDAEEVISYQMPTYKLLPFSA